jgi:hypothetical protein
MFILNGHRHTAKGCTDLVVLLLLYALGELGLDQFLVKSSITL